MPNLCWLNGTVTPLGEARISVEDRGFLFADGVYEALRVYNGRPFGLMPHLDRLERSCGGIEMALPGDKQTLASEILKVVKASEFADATVYLQVTRGTGERNHLFPKNPNPTTMFYVRQLPPLPPIAEVRPYTLHGVPDERWGRCWIKCICLTASMLARNAADKVGADEAIFVDRGIVREGSSTNVWAVINGTLVTHPIGPRILAGVTRDFLLQCARDIGIPVQEREMTLEEALRADEVFLSSSIREIMPVTTWDGTTIPRGPVAAKLHEAYRSLVARAEG